MTLIAVNVAAMDDADNPALPDPVSYAQSDAQSHSDSVRVALVDSGVNYQLEFINKALARDASGKLIGYDFWDLDDLPFDSHPLSNGFVQRHGTRTASILIREAPFVKLVPYRYPRPDMQRMAALVEHAEQHAVRIIGISLGGGQREPWLAFEAAARTHPHILFVVSAGNNGRNIDTHPVYPASLDLPNMLVVTSADDFGRLATGVNWGRNSVDYMVPAQSIDALQFDGQIRAVSGSSYAVPRVVALAARYLRDDLTLDAKTLVQKIRTKFGNGTEPQRLSGGYLFDPQFDPLSDVGVIQTTRFELPNASDTDQQLPLQLLVLDERWHRQRIDQMLKKAGNILKQCNIVFVDVKAEYLDVPDYLRDLETGAARTLMEAIRQGGVNRRLTVVLGRETRMSTPFDAEAFGRGNTRSRQWLTDSVWLTQSSDNSGVVLAHELFHVLMNSGDHSQVSGSLMSARVNENNTRLAQAECELAVQRARGLGLLAVER